jgi:hypothetical protein
MLELEVYSTGVRETAKVLALDRELSVVPGLRYKIDPNHSLVYLELDGPTLTVTQVREIFRRCGMDPRIVGAIPPAMNPGTKTQRLSN